MANADPRPTIAVEVVVAPAPHCIDRVALVLPAGATVQDALDASGIASRLPVQAMAALRLGLWGRLCEPQTVLRERDRVELYRPLQVDPKEARRLRYRRDGVQRATRTPRTP